MLAFYIRKVQIGLGRVLSGSEQKLASDFFASGYSVNYAIEYFK